ncbi:TPA_asm: recombination protein bet [Cyanophage Cy-LDV1]|nr:TPA_asm: recombination protein bet [Cyanophage Cy-LDV1]
MREQPANLPAATPAHLLHIAVSQGADMEKLEKLMQLQERWEANEARKAFVSAMAAFKAEPMTVKKSKTVDFTSQKGRTHYTHATLADVVDAAVAGMGKHGLSHRWDVRQEAGRITVQCIVTHDRGHSESTSLTSNPDDSGNKNQIQQVGSAITYLQRYTLMAVLGLAASDMQDDDGRGSGQPEPTLSEEQQAAINDLLEASGSDRAKFLAWAKVERVADIPASWFARCKSVLAKKLEGSNAAAA